MVHLYYTPYRPPMPGSVPKEGLLSVRAFDEKTFIKEAGREVWGYAIYNRKLAHIELYDYELLEGIIYESVSEIEE